MKQRIIILTLALLAFYPISHGQQQSVITDQMMNSLFVKFKQIQRAAELERQRDFKEFEAALDKGLAARFASILALQKEDARMAKEYRPGYQHKPGEMNLFPVFEDIPAPVPSLPEAKTVNFDQKYRAFIDRVEVMMKQLSDMEAQHVAQQRTGKDQMMRDAKNEANKNAVVQQMGGADAFMKMSEAERKNAARNMKENVLNNTGAYSGVSDPGMNAMMKRMMNDPAYREKYNKMSDAEKEAELKSYMTNKTIPRDDKAFEQSMAERNKTNYQVSIQQLLGRCLERMLEASKQVGNSTRIADEFYTSLYMAIAKWHKEQADALPVVVSGEMREKVGLGALNKFREAIEYAIQKREAVTRTILWTSLKLRTKLAFGEFNDFIGSYHWGKEKNENLIDGSYTEAQVAKAVQSIYDQMVQFTNSAEGLTSKHKGQQEQYELIMK
ncbi:MAG: hypothetical protein NTW29_19300 [Bacteroidetes bacterium]|nr:hypothetical protein [Bacteroidota bacterium]